jgi:Leucine Rich repeat
LVAGRPFGCMEGEGKRATESPAPRKRLAGDAGAKEIAASGILKRLRVLELQLGCISDEGAKALAASPDVKNLQLLDLSHNALTPEGIAALKATGVKVVAEQQHDHTRYDADDENEFLWHGDAE